MNAMAEYPDHSVSVGQIRTSRIAMFTNLFAPVASGSSIHVNGLSRALVANGHDVIVVTPRLTEDHPSFEVVNGVKVYRIPALRLPKMQIALNFPWLNWTFWPKNIDRIQKILEDEKVEIIHAHNHMFDMAFSGRVLSNRLRIPYVVTLHTIINHAHPVYDFILAGVDRHFLSRIVISSADELIAPDKNMRDYASERFGRDDVPIITYGLDTPEIPSESDIDEVRREFGLVGKRVILSLGHVHAVRNRLDLIKSFPRILERVPTAILLVVGGVMDQSGVRLAKELGLSDKVIFAGAQPRERVPAFLAAADLEAHWLNQDNASRTSPGIASMEAMYAGLPVVTVSPSDIYGPDLLRDGENVIIVPQDDPVRIADKISAILTSADGGRAVGVKAAALCRENFSWPNVATQTARLYHRLLVPNSRA